MPVTLARIVPSGTWPKAKVTCTLGKPGIEFDLHVLAALIPFRDELLKLDVRWVVAWGARFRDGDGFECVAGLNLENRGLNLWPIGNDWHDGGWFGRLRK